MHECFYHNLSPFSGVMMESIFRMGMLFHCFANLRIHEYVVSEVIAAVLSSIRSPCHATMAVIPTHFHRSRLRLSVRSGVLLSSCDHPLELEEDGRDDDECDSKHSSLSNPYFTLNRKCMAC